MDVKASVFGGAALPVRRELGHRGATPTTRSSAASATASAMPADVPVGPPRAGRDHRRRRRQLARPAAFGPGIGGLQYLAMLAVIFAALTWGARGALVLASCPPS